MPFPYVTIEEVEDRIGRALVARAIDANGDGDPDPAVLTSIIEDACSRVRSRAMVSIDEAGIAAIEDAVDAPVELKRLSIAAVRIELIQAAPGVFPDHDWSEMERSLNKQLDDWSSGRANLGGSPPENEPSKPGIALRIAGFGRGW